MDRPLYKFIKLYDGLIFYVLKSSWKIQTIII